MPKDVICGLDIGSSSIRAVIGRMEADREHIVGFAEAPTKGFSKSIVSNLALLSDAIESCVTKAEDIAHCRVRRVITNVSGVHIRTFPSRGSVHIADRPSEITKEDVKRCIESARLIAMSLDREAVHLVPVRYFIDDKMEISEPLGLFGSKLDVDLNIITALVTVLQNITKAVNLAGYEVEDIIVSGLGMGLAVFDKEELESGAVSIDVGKEITEMTVFVDGKLRDCFNFPFGGDDLTQVLQDNLKIMFDEAEGIKLRYGIVTQDLSKIDDTEVVIPSIKRTQDIQIQNVVKSKSEISNLLMPKLVSAIEEIYKRLEPFLKDKKRVPHISIGGGSSKMDGFIESVDEIFKVPVDMARIRNADEISDISFACGLGLMRYGVKKIMSEKPRIIRGTGGILANVAAKIKSLFSEYF